MKTLNELIEQAKASLPPCDGYSKDEIRIITMIVEPSKNPRGAESHTFIITFAKEEMDGAKGWELKDVETKLIRSEE